MTFTRRRRWLLIAVVVLATTGLAGVAVVQRQSTSRLADSYPAAPYMNAYMGYWGSQGKGGAEQLCLSALYSTYYYAEYVWGPSVGLRSGAGAGLFGVYFTGQVGGRCPGPASDGVNNHFGISCLGPLGVSCPEGAGPYVSVGSTFGHNAFIGAEGYGTRRRRSITSGPTRAGTSGPSGRASPAPSTSATPTRSQWRWAPATSSATADSPRAHGTLGPCAVG